MHYRALNQLTRTPNTPWSLRMAASALSRYPVHLGQWHYKDGLLFTAIFRLWEQTGDEQYWHSLKAYVDHCVDASGAIRDYTIGEYNLDQINAGKVLFPVYKATSEDRYRQAIFSLREQLRGQPRTHEGAFWHKNIYPFQTWLDGIYMAGPFYAQFAATFDEQDSFADIIFQIIAIEKHTRDPQSGLLYHAWDESRQQRWANPETGCSPHFWSRAIGWYVMALVDVLDYLPQDHASRKDLVEILERTISAVTRVQDETTGLWWQVLDQGGRQGNYLEASGTCMYVYAIARGVRGGYLPDRWLAVATKGFKGLLKHMVTVDDEGQVDLHGICASAGLGGSPYRDGSFEYYVSEPVSTNDLHGVGSFILAAAEMELARDSGKKS